MSKTEKEILQERIHNAVNKMKEAKDAYNKIVDCPEQYKKDDLYMRNYSDIQGKLGSAIDIVLGVFIEEKMIKSGGTTTLDMCKAILLHNKNEGTSYLEDVDFAQFLKFKPNRNIEYHVGEQRELQEVDRVILNLNRILLALDSNEKRETVIVDNGSTSTSFEFETFSAYMQTTDEDRRYILITDPLHDIDKKQMEAFVSIPWSIILDFDAVSERGGLKSRLKSSRQKYNSFTISYLTAEKNTLEYNNNIIYVDLCDDENLKNGIVANCNSKSKPNEDDHTMIKKLLSIVRDASHPYATIVIVGEVNNRMNRFCIDIAGEFEETDIVILTKQLKGNQYLPQESSEEESEETGIIRHVYQMNTSVFDAFGSIYSNISFLRTSMASLISDDEGITMPNSVRLKNEFVERYDEVEFVHCGLGKNPANTHEWEFYHGDIITWDAINAKCALPLIGDRFEVFANKMLESNGHQCFYVLHRAGFGGSTLARQLVWEIHNKVPVVCLKKYKNKNDFSKLINDLYKGFEKSKFWILVDENDISDGDIEEIEREVINGDYRICALIVKRIDEKSAVDRNKEKKENEIIISLVENNAKNILESKCCGFLNDNTIYEKRKREMDANLEEKHKCPLLINLYLLEENFKLDTFVAGCLSKISEDYDKIKMLDSIAFLAIGSFYSNLKIPESYFKQYLGIKAGSLDFKCYDGLVLKKKEDNVTKYSITHYYIAQEVLVQVLGGNDPISWKGHLKEYIFKYIDWLAEMVQGLRCIDDDILYILSAMFTDKTKSRDMVGKNYTYLLDYMDEYRRLDVMCYLAEKFQIIIENNIPMGKNRKEYKLLAHIYAQLARVRLDSSRITESNEEEIENSKYQEFEGYLQKAISIIETETIRDFALEDILARCSIARAKKYRDRIEVLSEEDVKFIRQLVDNAIEHFQNTIYYGSPDYGVPGKLDALSLGLSIIIDYYGIDEKNRIENVNEKAPNYLEDVFSVFSEIDENNLSKEALTFAYNSKSRIEKLLYPGKTSDLLQRLNNLYDKLDPSEYDKCYFVSTQIVYAYERKYFDDNSGRNTLLMKALNGDANAKNDAEKVFENLERIIKMNVNHSIASSTYNKWFEYAKYMDVPLSRAKDVAREWKECEVGKDIRNTSLLRPYYYLFVISLLQYKAGSDGVTAEEVKGRKNDLGKLKNSMYIGNRYTVYDWFGKGKGMHQLFSREWIDIKDIAKEDQISIIKGKVVDVVDDKNSLTTGYLKITDPRMLGNWSKPIIGETYSKDCYVRFVERETKIIQKRDVGSDREIELKMGFSYDSFEASMNSIEALNYGYKKPNAVRDQEKSIPTKEVQTMSIPPIREGELVDFYPTEFKPKVVRGTVNGINASVNKRQLKSSTKGLIKQAIDSHESIKAKMDRINPQKNGYILKIED